MAGGRPMSAQETTIAVLQNRLHEENQRRFEQIEKNQDNQSKMLGEVLKNTADLPDLKKDVEKLKSDRNKIKGAASVGAWLGGGSLLGEAIRWMVFRK